MDGVQLPQDYSHFEEAVYFLTLVPRNSWYSLYRPRKDERLSRPWNHPVVLNTGPLDWESSTLTTRPLSSHLPISRKTRLTLLLFYIKLQCSLISTSVFSLLALESSLNLSGNCVVKNMSKVTVKIPLWWMKNFPYSWQIICFTSGRSLKF